MSNTAKKTHWLRTTLIVLILCGLAGTILAVVKFKATNSASYVSSVLEMNYVDAARGLAPNGNPLDTQEIASDEVLESALEAASLSGTYTPEQIRASLEIRGIFPEDLQEQITSSTSVLNMTAATISDYHPTSFEVRLSNKFDPAVSQSAQTSLLQHILTAYKAHFAVSGANKVETGISVFNLPDYDYIQQLSIVQTRLQNIDRYVTQMDRKFPDFRLDGKGFDDISARIANLMTGDLSRIGGQVMVNGVSKNKERLLEQYEYEFKSLNETLAAENENLARLDKLIEAYEKNATIYVSTTASLNMIKGNSSATYDWIVAQRKEIADHTTEVMKKIEEYQKKIADLTGVTLAEEVTEAEAVETAVEVAAGETAAAETEAEKAFTEEAAAFAKAEGETAAEEAEQESAASKAAVTERVEADLSRLIERERQIVADFDTMVQAENAEEINDLTVRFSAVRYTAPKLLSGAFLKQVIKTAGPFCAIGFMVCMMLIFISRRKEEKTK